MKAKAHQYINMYTLHDQAASLERLFSMCPSHSSRKHAKRFLSVASQAAANRVRRELLTAETIVTPQAQKENEEPDLATSKNEEGSNPSHTIFTSG